MFALRFIRYRSCVRPGLSLLAVLWLSGCAVFSVPSNLASGVMANDDLELVEEGLPAYLLTMDGMVRSYPDNAGILSAAAELNSAYAGVFVEDPERQKRLTRKALGLAHRAACAESHRLCPIEDMELAAAQDHINAIRDEDLAPALYRYGSIWAGYIQAHSGDWDAVAGLGKAEKLLERQVALQPGYNAGMGELYLAVIASVLPPALGGQPDSARALFEQALEYGGDTNLIIKVYYAQKYARMMFDQEMHDRLLQEVLAADPGAGDLTLQNHYAQRLARELLASSDDYFL